MQRRVGFPIPEACQQVPRTIRHRDWLELNSSYYLYDLTNDLFEGVKVGEICCVQRNSHDEQTYSTLSLCTVFSNEKVTCNSHSGAILILYFTVTHKENAQSQSTLITSKQVIAAIITLKTTATLRFLFEFALRKYD